MSLWSKIERHNNLPFDNVIATSKETKHTRILFQKVNSLEISSGYNTLELICDSIGQLEIDIVCLVEITTHWKYPREEASLKVTSNRHWRYSHISTSQTEIKWTGLCILWDTVIITLQLFFSDITTSGDDLHGLDRWSYISIKGRENNNITIIFAYRTYQFSIKTQDYQ